MIFILGSPRTGSTLIYQIMINFYNLFYFTNLTNNYFYKYPLIGSLISAPFIKDSGYESDHGKTNGLFGPSEGSYVFKNWFGAGNSILPNKTLHMKNTLNNICKFTNKPLIIKNAWNCFRIGAIYSLFPNAMFIWIRRNIIVAAYSDLEARYIRGGPHVWNSAPTSNCAEIQMLPYWEQVVEQQYEYNEIIRYDLNKFYSGKHIELWYEDICSDLENQISRISKFFGMNTTKMNLPAFEMKIPPHNEDFVKIKKYVNNNSKFDGYIK